MSRTKHSTESLEIQYTFGASGALPAPTSNDHPFSNNFPMQMNFSSDRHMSGRMFIIYNLRYNKETEGRFSRPPLKETEGRFSRPPLMALETIEPSPCPPPQAANKG